MSYEVAVEMNGGRWKRYPAYKDSGVEWLGEVPEHWEVKRLRYLIKYLKGKKPEKISDTKEDDAYLPYLSMEYLRNSHKSKLYSEHNCNTILVEDGDLLLLWDGSNAGEFILGKKGILSSTMAKLIKVDDGAKQYLFYMLKYVERVLKELTIGMGIPHVNSNILNDFFCPFPTLEEQNIIKAYLNNETGRIDTLIEKKERQVELLQEKRAALISHAVTKGLNPDVKMKDSGVESLGEVPEHWKTIRLKYAFILMRGFDLASDKFLDGCYPVRGSNGIIGYHDEYTTVGPSITVGRSGSVGEVHYIESNFWAHNTSLYVKYFKQAYPKFSYYLLKTLDLKSLSAGSAVGTLNRNYIHDLPITIPNYSEQRTIAAFLDRETGRIDTLTTKVRESISKVREYRTALISAAVTGKIDVREEFVS